MQSTTILHKGTKHTLWIEKGGAGSRGGVVIGYKNGKAIYASKHSSEDLEKKGRKIAGKHTDLLSEITGLRNQAKVSDSSSAKSQLKVKESKAKELKDEYDIIVIQYNHSVKIK